MEGSMVALELPGQRAVVSDADGGIQSYTVDEAEVLCCCSDLPELRSGATALVTQLPLDAGSDLVDVSTSWTCVDSSDDRVDLEARPHGTTLVHHLSYRLEPGGLVATSSTTNEGPEPLIYAPEKIGRAHV